MKNKFLALLVLSMIGIGGVTPTVYAKPERMEIEKADKRASKHAAKAILKTVDVNAIEDPEARKAIKAIISVLQAGK